MPEVVSGAGGAALIGDCPTELWSAKGGGFEQLWVVSARLAGSGPLLIEVDVQALSAGGADTSPASGSWVIHEFNAWDSAGRRLPVQAVGDRTGFEIRVDDCGARYPVLVDPLYSEPSTTFVAPVQDSNFGAYVSDGGDLNGDGFDDLLVGGTGGAQGVYTNVYAGSSQGPMSESAVTVAGYGIVGVADLDGDGHPDLAGYSFPGADDPEAYPVPTVWPGSADGFAGTPYDIVFDAEFLYSGPPASAGDVNGDGYADLVVGRGNGTGYDGPGAAVVCEGSDAGVSGDGCATLLSSEGGAFLSWPSGVGDVNGDGYDDVLAANFTGTALVYLGGGEGLSTAPSATLEVGGQVESGGGIADFDADGFGDIVLETCADSSPATVAVYPGSALGPSETATVSLTDDRSGFALGWGQAAGVGDVDGDGVDDLLLGEWPYPDLTSIVLYPGSADGVSAGSHTEVFGPVNSSFGYSVAGVGDVDGDGYGDVLVGAPALIPNTGDWGPGTAYLYRGYPKSGDQDADGVPASNDCDDADPAIGAPTDWYLDEDGDGWGGAMAEGACTQPAKTASTPGDCNDADPTIHPGATDIPGDGIDQDCDGTDGSGGADSDDAPESGSPKHGCVGCGTGTATPAPFALLAVSLVLARRRRA